MKHYIMASIAAVGLVCLTIARVWRVVGVEQTIFQYAILTFFGIDHFVKARQ